MDCGRGSDTCSGNWILVVDVGGGVDLVGAYISVYLGTYLCLDKE